MFIIFNINKTPTVINSTRNTWIARYSLIFFFILTLFSTKLTIDGLSQGEILTRFGVIFLHLEKNIV